MPDSYREPVEEKSQSEAPAASQLEQEVLELERQLAAKKAALQEKEKPLEQVLAKERPLVSPAVAPTAPPSAAAATPATIKEEAQKLKGFEKNQQLKALIDLAFLKEVSYATEVARHLDNPYLMDEFHDTLIDEFHQKLVESGKLEEI